MAAYLAGRTADYEQVAGLQPGGLQQFGHSLAGLAGDLFIHHDKPPFGPAGPAGFSITHLRQKQKEVKGLLMGKLVGVTMMCNKSKK